MPAGEKGGRRVYLAFNEGRLNRFLNTDDLAFRMAKAAVAAATGGESSPNATRWPEFLIGRIVCIQPRVAGVGGGGRDEGRGMAERENPFELAEKTRYYVLDVELFDKK